MWHLFSKNKKKNPAQVKKSTDLTINTAKKMSSAVVLRQKSPIKPQPFIMPITTYNQKKPPVKRAYDKIYSVLPPAAQKQYKGYRPPLGHDPLYINWHIVKPTSWHKGIHLIFFPDRNYTCDVFYMALMGKNQKICLKFFDYHRTFDNQEWRKELAKYYGIPYHQIDEKAQHYLEFTFAEYNKALADSYGKNLDLQTHSKLQKSKTAPLKDRFSYYI